MLNRIWGELDRRASRPGPEARGGSSLPLRHSIAVLLVGLGYMAAPAGAAGQTARDAGAPTFTRDIAPILQRSCQACHRAEGMAPMALETYEQVRPWARAIQLRTETRKMPPWHLDPSVGVREYENDVSLSEEEIALIGRWVEAGSPEGDPAHLPPPLAFPAGGEWELEEEFGPPDLVVRSSPYDIPAYGQDQWHEPQIPFEGIPEDRYIRAAEFKPSYPLGVKVTHHGHAQFVPEGADGGPNLISMGIGKLWEVMPEGMGKLLPAGPGEIHWNLHYAPAGEAADETVVEVGVWFYPEGYVPDIVVRGETTRRVDTTSRTGLRARDLIIPPHGRLILESQYVLEKPTLLQSFRPHMHARGTGMSLQVVYPDGRKEVISSVNQYNHHWQISYVYADGKQPLLPAGSVMILHAQFDNTVNNPINPDPDQWVFFGQRGVDEMSHLWLGLVELTDEQFERLSAERATADDR